MFRSLSYLRLESRKPQYLVTFGIGSRKSNDEVIRPQAERTRQPSGKKKQEKTSMATAGVFRCAERVKCFTSIAQLCHISKNEKKQWASSTAEKKGSVIFSSCCETFFPFLSFSQFMGIGSQKERKREKLELSRASPRVSCSRHLGKWN